MRQPAGFTLIELILVLTVGAILASLAAPAMRGMIQDNRATAHANALASALALARSEAVRRGAPTWICAADDGWQDGWSVRAGATCAAGETLNVYPPLTGIDARADNNGAAVDRIGYGPDGFKAVPSNVAVVFTLHPDDCATGAAERARTLIVSATGRANIARADCT